MHDKTGAILRSHPQRRRRYPQQQPVTVQTLMRPVVNTQITRSNCVARGCFEMRLNRSILPAEKDGHRSLLLKYAVKSQVASFHYPTTLRPCCA